MPASIDVTLFRAVGLNEAGDLVAFGGFRLLPSSGYEEGKWFAASFDDAVRWGRAMQRFTNPRPFRVVAILVPATLLDEIEFHARWDGIGPAYFVFADQLAWLNRVGVVTIFEPLFDVE